MMKNILFFIVFLFSLSCSKKDIAIQPINKNTDSNMISFLALGDSYTIGEGVKEEERWPVLLTKGLKAEGYNIAPPKIIATTGWTTDDLIKAVEKEDLGTFDLVSLLIGVNNQYRSQDFQIYEKEFKVLLQKAIKYAGDDPSKVFVVSIPDYSVTPFGQSHDPYKTAIEIDNYNEFNKEVAEEMGVTYFDITPISRNAAKDKSLLAEDQLHPSGKMYQQWVDIMIPVIEKKLQ